MNEIHKLENVIVVDGETETAEIDGKISSFQAWTKMKSILLCRLLIDTEKVPKCH